MKLISENLIRCGSVQNAECFFSFFFFSRKCLLSPGGDNGFFFLTELILVLGSCRPGLPCYVLRST